MAMIVGAKKSLSSSTTELMLPRVVVEEQAFWGSAVFGEERAPVILLQVEVPLGQHEDVGLLVNIVHRIDKQTCVGLTDLG